MIFKRSTCRTCGSLLHTNHSSCVFLLLRFIQYSCGGAALLCFKLLLATFDFIKIKQTTTLSKEGSILEGVGAFPFRVTHQRLPGRLVGWGRELQSDWLKNAVGRSRAYLRLCSIVSERFLQLVRLKGARGRSTDRGYHRTFFFYFTFGSLSFNCKRSICFINVFFLQPVSGWQFPSVPGGGQRLAEAVLEQSAAEAHRAEGQQTPALHERVW